MAVSPFLNLRNLVLNKCNNFLLPGSSRDTCYKFLLDGYFVGFIHPLFLDWLLKYSKVFIRVSHPKYGDHCVTIHQSLTNLNDRSNAVAEVMQDLRTTSPIKALKGWRNEDYGVYIRHREKALLRIERSASCLLGIIRYDNVFMWLGLRSMDKPTWPGMLDNMTEVE
ncbi:unnamed protein product [Trichobilharzia regenti]|nr:unnamed protein product [Trichobilharzia regenti]